MRIHSILLALLGSCLCVTALADTGATDHLLLGLDATRARATVAADLPVLERLLGEDLTYGHTNGQLEGKREFLDKLRSGARRYKALSTEDVHARVFGTAAVVTGTAAAEVESDGKPMSFELRYTATYVQRQGQWVLVAYQSVRLP